MKFEILYFCALYVCLRILIFCIFKCANLINLILFSIFENFTSWKMSQECQMSKISVKFAMKFEIQKGLKYEICYQNICVLLSDRPLVKILEFLNNGSNFYLVMSFGIKLILSKFSASLYVTSLVMLKSLFVNRNLWNQTGIQGIKLKYQHDSKWHWKSIVAVPSVAYISRHYPKLLKRYGNISAAILNRVLISSVVWQTQPLWPRNWWQIQILSLCRMSHMKHT